MTREIYLNEEKIPAHLKISRKKTEKIIQRKVKEIKTYFQRIKFKKVVIGLSGGLDSSVSFCLARRALGARNIICLLMPYTGVNSNNSINDALNLAKVGHVPRKNIFILPINKSVNAAWQMLKKVKGGNLKIRKGNLMARGRMKFLFDMSSAKKAIVLGTEDRTEQELAYFTIGGDECSGIEPIINLWKTEVFQLAKFLEEVPAEVLLKPPSPGLWLGQTAEKEMGLDYLSLDIILSAIYDLKISPSRIVKKFGIKKNSINLVLKRLKITEGKKHLPYILKN